MADGVPLNMFELLGDDDDDSNQKPTKKKSKEVAPVAAPAKPRTENKGRRTGTGDDKKVPRKNTGKDTGARGKGGKRQFERHSGTGRDDGPKKQGKGKFGWESSKADGDAEEGEEKKVAADEDNQSKEPQEKEEEGPPVKTLEEYRQEQAAKLVGDNLQTRKAEVDESKWQKSTQRAEPEAEEELWNDPQVKTGRKKARAGKKLIHLDEFASTGPKASGGEGGERSERRSAPREGERRERREPREPREDRRDRGDRPPRGDRPDRSPRGSDRGRGGGRGGRGGGRGRGAGRGGGAGREGGNFRGGRGGNVNVADDKAFPALGK